MKNTTLSLIAAIFIQVVCSSVQAQAPEKPATTSAPATQPRRELTIPTGFKKITVNGRQAVCEPAEEAWITAALTKMPATTKPTTLPTTLLQKLIDNRKLLIDQITADLALADSKEVETVYDKDLIGELRTLENLRPPIFYLITTPDRLAAAMRAGWSDPHFYYNRAADAVSFNPSGILVSGKQMDDAVFPVVFDPKETPEKRGEAIIAVITSTEASIGASIDIRAQQLIGAILANMVNNLGIAPLKLKDDQQWFGLGVASILSAKYAAVITGEPRDKLMQMLTYENTSNPLKASAVDLLHPQDVKMMRNEALGAYFDTVRRKSARALQFLVEKGTDAAIPKSIAAIRAKAPADGPAMAKVIQEATGIDLAPLLVKGN